MKTLAALQNGTITTLCRMCDAHCAIDVHLKNGVMVDVTPFEGHPINQGRMCPRGGASIDLFYHRERQLTPLKRQADGSFAKISYDQALEEIAAKMKAIKAAYGAKAVGVWKGEGVGFLQQEEYARRFAQAFGTPNYFSNDSACYVGRYLGYHLVTGFWNSFPEFADAKLILLFGTNPPMCHPPFMREFADAHQKGAKLVVIDPRFNPVACYADVFAQPYPGTDGALIWGLIHYLIETRSYDSDLVERHTIGFEKIAACAKRFTPEFVETQSGIYAHVVEEVARLIIKSRPHVSIFPGAGLEHHENGVNAVRALAILTCLIGAIGVSCGLYHPQPLGRRKLTLDDPLPSDENHAIGAADFPVFHKLRREGHTMTAMEYMLGKGEYPLKGLIMTAANPAVTNPNTRKVEQALSALDLLVVNCLQGAFPTPSGKIEFASQGLKELGLPEIPEYEPPYHLRLASPAFPFVLTTGARKSLFYHSRHQNIARFRTVHPHPLMEMHPADAALLNIEDNERVRVISEIGTLEIQVTIVNQAELRRGVVEIYHGWEECRVNFLTYDQINDPISGFPLLKAVPVSIEKLS